MLQVLRIPIALTTDAKISQGVAKNKQNNFGFSEYLFIDSEVTSVQRVRLINIFWYSKEGERKLGELDGMSWC
jgi:hypothetical protein